MPRTPERPAFWRFIAPSLLLVAPLLGILPVVRLGLEGSPKAFEAENKIREQMGKSKIGKDGTVIKRTQNAYQTIWAGYSLGPEDAADKAEAEKKAKEWEREHPEEVKKLKEAAAQMAKDMKAKGAKEVKDENEPGAAVLIIFYFVFLFGAVVVGYAMPLGTLRTIIFSSLTGVTALILLIQVLVGFPVQSKFEELMKKQEDVLAAFGGQISKDAPKPFCRQTLWLHLTWPVLLGAIGVAGVEMLLAGGGKRKKSRRDYEDDEDDRPRKKKSRTRDEDDDDDRPRKKSRRDENDEEEDERPRKKSRARDEDDDEDERPRKKVRARDDDDEDDQRIRKRR